MFRLLTILLCLFSLTACVGTPQVSVDTDLQKLRQVIQSQRQMLEEYYKDSGVLQETWLDGRVPRTERLADKFARTFVWQDDFVLATMGSSVVVGDGNCRYDNYQSQLDRLLQPVFDVAGIDLQIRVSAQGGECGDSHRNQVWCIDALAGADVDVIHYSWTYFEAGDTRKEKIHERFLRWSLLQPGSPVPQILYASECSNASEKDKQLLEAYRDFGSNTLCMTRALPANGWKGKVWGEIGDAMHVTTREGEHPWLSQERRDSLGVVFRNWHPGPLLYQTTSDVLAYSYMEAMLIAIDRIEASDDPGKDWPSERSQISYNELPELQLCDEPWCDVESPPSCLTFSHPTFGESDISWDAETSDWQLVDDPVRTSYPEKGLNLEICKYDHHCGGLAPPEGDVSQPLRFQLPKFEHGFVGVCCLGKQCGAKLIEADLSYTINGKTLSESPQVMYADKCVEIQSSTDDAGMSEESNELVIEVPADRDIPRITHVIVL